MKSENLEVLFSLGERFNFSEPYIDPSEPTRSLECPLYNLPIKAITQFVDDNLLHISFEYSMAYTKKINTSDLFLCYDGICALVTITDLHRVTNVMLHAEDKNLTKESITNLFNKGAKFVEPSISQKVTLLAIGKIITKLIPRWNKHNEK